MPRKAIPLTEDKISQAKPQEKEYQLYDGNNLILRVRVSGSKRWIYRYYKSDGSQTHIGLGSYPDVSIAVAREKVAKIKQAILEGEKIKDAIDPNNVIKLKKIMEDYNLTPKKVAETMHKSPITIRAYVRGSKRIKDCFIKRLEEKTDQISVKYFLNRKHKTKDQKNFEKTKPSKFNPDLNELINFIKSNFIEFNKSMDIEHILVLYLISKGKITKKSIRDSFGNNQKNFLRKVYKRLIDKKLIYFKRSAKEDYRYNKGFFTLSVNAGFFSNENLYKFIVKYYFFLKEHDVRLTSIRQLLIMLLILKEGFFQHNSLDLSGVHAFHAATVRLRKLGLIEFMQDNEHKLVKRFYFSQKGRSLAESLDFYKLS